MKRIVFVAFLAIVAIGGANASRLLANGSFWTGDNTSPNPNIICEGSGALCKDAYPNVTTVFTGPSGSGDSFNLQLRSDLEVEP